MSMLVATGGREDCADEHGKHESPDREPEAGPTITRDGWLHDKQASGQDNNSDLESCCNSVHPSQGFGRSGFGSDRHAHGACPDPNQHQEEVEADPGD